LFPDFVFGYVEDASNVFNHLLVRPGGFGFSRAIWRGRGDDIGSTPCAFVVWRRRAGWDENGGGSVGHVVDCRANLDKVTKWLSETVFMTKAENVLLEAFVEVVVNGIGRSQFGETKWR